MTPSSVAPLVVRPRVLVAHASAWTVVLVLFFVLGFFAFPPEVRALFTPLQIATLLFFLAFMLGFVWVVAACYVRADADGLTYRNGLATHRTPWRDVAGIRYRDGDAWAFVLLDRQGTKRALMGVMRVDGRRAVQAVEELRRRASEANAV